MFDKTKLTKITTKDIFLFFWFSFVNNQHPFHFSLKCGVSVKVLSVPHTKFVIYNCLADKLGAIQNLDTKMYLKGIISYVNWRVFSCWYILGVFCTWVNKVIFLSPCPKPLGSGKLFTLPENPQRSFYKNSIQKTFPILKSVYDHHAEGCVNFWTSWLDRAIINDRGLSFESRCCTYRQIYKPCYERDSLN